MDDHRRRPPVDFLPACDESQGCDRIPWAASVLPIAVRARRILSRLQAESGTRVTRALPARYSAPVGWGRRLWFGWEMSDRSPCAPVPLSSARFGVVGRMALA